MLCLAVSAPALARADESVLSVDDGTQVRAIARLVGGRWMAEMKCVAPGADRNPSVRERLTVSGAIQLLAVRAVAPGSAEWLRLVPAIVEQFERREREERLSDRTSDAPRAVDWIYISEDGDRRTYYFEASRRVSNVSADVDHDVDPPGTLRIAVAGFLQDARDRLAALGTKSELRWEQDGLPAGPSRADLTPLGVVVQGDRKIWVMKGLSGASVRFMLYDVSASGTRTLLTARVPRC